MWDILAQQALSGGGFVLLALLLASLAGVTVSVFKVLQFARMGVGRHAPARRSLDNWRSGRVDDALREASSGRTASLRVLEAALRPIAASGAMRDRARDAATNVALGELSRMSAHMRLLEAVVQGAPMLGLLGTVIGMIQSFAQLSAQGGAADPAVLAGGIWTALITTAFGLSIAIPFYFISAWLEGRIESERQFLEQIIAASQLPAR